MQKSFSFKGITRDTDNLYVKEGECTEVVNMRFENGVAVPVSAPSPVAVCGYRFSAIYRHEKTAKYLCIETGCGKLHIYNDDFTPYADTVWDEASSSCGQVTRVEFLGNVVIIFTAETMYYAIYDMGHYKWLGERPQMPQLSFDVETMVHSVDTDDKYLTGVSLKEDDRSLYWVNVEIGYLNECISKLNARGCYIDRVLFRYAFRLFDGSYAWFSPIYYVEDNGSVAGLSRDNGNFYSYAHNALSETLFTAMVQGFRPTFVFDTFDLSAWENIIVSIDIFSTGSIMGHKVTNSSNIVSSRVDGVQTSDSYGYDRYVSKSNTELCNDIMNASLFYKVAEFDLKGTLVDSIGDVSQSSLALASAMGEDVITHVGRTAMYSYVFNNRLHIANLHETFFRGYSGRSFVPATMPAVKIKGCTIVELKTMKGSAVVKRDFGDSFYIGESGGMYYITPYIMYPDARAVKITFVLTIGGRILQKSFELSAHKMLDVAHYLNSKDLGLTVSCSGEFTAMASVTIISSENILEFFSYKPGSYVLVYSDDALWMYGNTPLVFDEQAGGIGYYGTLNIRGTLTVGDKLTVVITESKATSRGAKISNIIVDDTWTQISNADIMKEVNCTDVRSNVLKVSDTDNPFAFPAAQTYAPSDSAIIAMCSNTVALSQGQFGQHPLYLFCADGIWAISVDASGSIAYSGCYPLSREVCVNAHSVRGIDSGVVFVSSKGLMLIDGSRITNLSSRLNTATDNEMQYPADSLLCRIASIVGLQQMVGYGSLRDYLSGAAVGYFYPKRELLVSNSRYPYSYILSLDSGEWSKYSYSFDAISNAYPHFMGSCLTDDGKSTVVTLHSDAAGENAIMMVSRPLLYGTKLHKRIMQMVLHADVCPAHSDMPFNGIACYLLCSNDGTNFKVIGGSERRTAFCDMLFPYLPTQSYRYFAVAVVGNITADSHITAVELDVSAAWNNRLN